MNAPPPTPDTDVLTTDERAELLRLRALLEHRNRQIEAIRRTSDALFSHPSVDAMVRATLDTALNVLRADSGTVYLHDAKSDTLVFRYVVGPMAQKLMGRSIPASQGVVGTVFRTHKATLTGNVEERGDWNSDVDKETGYHTESMMTVPIQRADGDPIGAMQVINARVPFTGRDLEVLQVLCAQAATGIEMARLAQEKAEESKKAEIVHVIGDISHDIKNMLTPILSGVPLLEDMLEEGFVAAVETSNPVPTPLVSARDNYGWMLDGFRNSALQVQARTKEIADAIRGESAPPFFEIVDFGGPCRDVAETLRLTAVQADVKLELELDPELPPVECDRKLIFNALYNLVNNAIPFTPAGGTITIRTASPKPGEECFTFEVEDTGRGMPEHIRERIERGEAPSTKAAGTGLGNRIVMNVIRRHHGDLRVRSREGVGSTFTVTLPLRHKEPEV